MARRERARNEDMALSGEGGSWDGWELCLCSGRQHGIPRLTVFTHADLPQSHENPSSQFVCINVLAQKIAFRGSRSDIEWTLEYLQRN